MTTPKSPPDLRVLISVSTVLGAGDSLESLNTTLVMDRALVAVVANNSLYMLRREASDAPSGTSIVEPSAGPGRWFIYPAGSSGGGIVPPAGQIDGTVDDPLIVGITDENGNQLPIGNTAQSTGGTSTYFLARNGSDEVVSQFLDTDAVADESNVTDGGTLTEALNTLLTTKAGTGPIQNTRWWDPASTVASETGSIVAPYKTVAPFWTAASGASGNWELRLPNGQNNPGSNMPTMPGGNGVIFVGLTGEANASTGLESLVINHQTNVMVEFRDMKMEVLQMADGTVNLRASNATIDDFTRTSTATGTIDLDRTAVTALALPGHDLTMNGGSLGGVNSLHSVDLHDVTVPNGSSITCVAGQTSRFSDVRFGTGVTLTLGAGGVAVMDPASWASYLSSTVTLASGTIRLNPSVPQLTFAAISTPISGSSVLSVDCGAATPPAKPNGQALATFRDNAPSSNFVCVGAHVNGSGNLIASILNLALTTQTCGQTVQFVYEPLGAP